MYSILRTNECIDYRVPCYVDDGVVTFVDVRAMFRLQLNLKANSKLVQMCELLKSFKEKQVDENLRVWIWSKHTYNQEYVNKYSTYI